MIDAVYEGLRQINKAGTALLIVEQQVDRVLEIAGSAVVLEHGSIAYSGSSDGALAAVEHVLASRGERTILAAEPDPPEPDPDAPASA
jgi:ABC-type branched-subunit amino acid transport system ATPase component